MSKQKGAQARGKYTLEFKLEAVRRVKKGQSVAVTAKTLSIPVQTLGNWVRLHAKGKLQGAGDQPVTAEQMELARLRAENSRLKMEHEILKKQRRTLRGHRCEVRLDCQTQTLLAGRADLRSARRECERLL